MSMRLVAQTQDVKNDLSNENIKAHHNTTERSRRRGQYVCLEHELKANHQWYVMEKGRYIGLSRIEMH